MTSEVKQKIEIAIASRRPDLLVMAIELLLPIARTWIEKLLGLNKDRKLELINTLIYSLPEDTPIHVVKDSVKWINENR